MKTYKSIDTLQFLTSVRIKIMFKILPNALAFLTEIQHSQHNGRVAKQ